MTGKRQRGIRASVPKLQHALLAAGMKTQSALADRIADLEGLENVPRGLVNKVFRGEPVDPGSIERVAAALGVEAWTLYANSSENSVDAAARAATNSTAEAAAQTADSQISSSPNASGNVLAKSAFLQAPYRSIMLFALALLGAAVLWMQWPAGEDSLDLAVTTDARQQAAIVDSANFVILPLAADRRNLDTLLGQSLQNYWRQLPAAIIGSDQQPDAQRITEAPGVDYVIELRREVRGRWQAVLVNLHQPGAMRSVWQAVIPLSISDLRLQAMLEQAAVAVVQLRELLPGSRDAQRKYLAGRYFLDQARTADNLRRALTEFESAIRADSNHAPSHAGLCEALVQEHIRSGDTARLAEAEGPCQSAMRLQPLWPEVLIAQATLARKRGLHAEAMTALQQALLLAPQQVDAMLGMAELKFGQYARGEDNQALIQALQILHQAATTEPDFWKTPYQQARLNYMGGDLEAALEAAHQAAELDANLLVLNNLGTLQFCAADFAAARESYLLAAEQDPDSFVGDGQIAVIDYNLGHFDDAVDGFAAALQRHAQSGAAEDHRLWGNYADALRHAGQHDQARQAYATAIALAERLYHEGDGQPMHAVATLYYQTMLSGIDHSLQPPLRGDIAALAIEPDKLDAIYKVYLAIVYQHLGQHEQARNLLTASAEGCRGLAISPDIMVAVQAQPILPAAAGSVADTIND